MGRSVPVKIGQKEFKSKKAAVDHFMECKISGLITMFQNQYLQAMLSCPHTQSTCFLVSATGAIHK
ncbi:hypothetical protein FJB88_22425 [Salmonella enterica subsp. enterica]|nr:hypothetical protein [Salmonella enterica subsp. enterica]